MIVEPLLELESYKQIKQEIEEGKTPILASGVLDSQKCHLIYALKKHLDRPALIITSNELKAKEIQEDMTFFTGGNAPYTMKAVSGSMIG